MRSSAPVCSAEVSTPAMTGGGPPLLGSMAAQRVPQPCRAAYTLLCPFTAQIRHIEAPSRGGMVGGREEDEAIFSQEKMRNLLLEINFFREQQRGGSYHFLPPFYEWGAGLSWREP
jgi:hypothetical protein